jgi:gamma-glutamylcyclotransferase (GGCT)/AIG2-like uncharacterized protein YtfP
MKRIFYFAYGSNLLSFRLHARIDDWISKQNFVLNNYKLVFNVSYVGFANIVPSEGDCVEGVLYEINAEQLKELSFHEGLYTSNFFDVNIPDGIGVVYIGQERAIPPFLVRPQLDYINIIIDGCKENGLKNTYKKLVAYKLQNFKLKKSKHAILE